MNAIGILRTVVAGFAWVVVALLIALGGAGIVASMHYVPGTAARAELTWDGDQAAVPALDAATIRLQALSDGVDGLGSTAREALTAVVAGDVDRVNESVSSGTLQLDSVLADATGLEDALAAVPGVGEESALVISPEVQARHDQLATTPAITAGLRADWTLFTGRALDAVNLNALLARHDQETAAAAKQGVAGKYQTALDLLDVSDATLATTRAARDRLANTTDVSTLTTWLDRNAAYDAALRDLYEALLNADGKVTSEVRAAIKGEQTARKNLPVDTRALVVIMSDVAQGGLNQAVISIEEARGALATALDAQRELQQGIEPPE